MNNMDLRQMAVEKSNLSHIMVCVDKELEDALLNAGCACGEGGKGMDMRYVEHVQSHIERARSHLTGSEYGPSLVLQPDVQVKLDLVNLAAEDLGRVCKYCRDGESVPAREFFAHANRYIQAAAMITVTCGSARGMSRV